MKTMADYTIYCTEEQTNKAFELGAPIEEDYRYKEDILFEEECLTCERQLVLPTAEQMIGWLEEQGFRFMINDLEEPTYWNVTIDGLFAVGELSTPKEATLAAIDAALDYLIKNRK